MMTVVMKVVLIYLGFRLVEMLANRIPRDAQRAED